MALDKQQPLWVLVFSPLAYFEDQVNNGSKAAVTNLSYLTDHQWSADHRLATAGLKCLAFGLAQAGSINGGSYYFYTAVFFLDLKNTEHVLLYNQLHNSSNNDKNSICLLIEVLYVPRLGVCSFKSLP